MSNGEYRKMEKELREFCGGNPIVIPGEEGRYSRGRIRTLRIKKKKKPGTRETMGGISKIVRVIRAIKEVFSEEKEGQDN